MDAFSAANSFASPNHAVNDYIVQRQHDFRQQVSQETWQLFESQQEILQLQSPTMTLQQMERVKINQRNVLNPNAIERMPTPYLLQTSNAFNQPLTLAHPELNKMHRLGQIEGYGIEQDDTRSVLLQNRIMSGMVVEQAGKGVHSEYADSVADLALYNNLSALERRVIQANQRSALEAIVDDLDFSSLYNGGF